MDAIVGFVFLTKKMYMIFPKCERLVKQICRGDPSASSGAKVELWRRHGSGRWTSVLEEQDHNRREAWAKARKEKMEGMLWEAEDLTGFPIKTEVHFGGMFKSTQVFTDVKLIEPDQSLFAPPAGFKTYASVEEFAKVVQKRFATDEQRVADFWKAAETGNVVQLESLTKQLPKLLQARRPDGQTPLHVAARASQKEAVQWLIEKKVDVKVKDNKGLTALHEAAAASSREVIELLVKAGAEIDTYKLAMVAHHCSRSANAQKDAVGRCYQSLVRVVGRDHEGMTALHLAAAPEARRASWLCCSCRRQSGRQSKRGETDTAWRGNRSKAMMMWLNCWRCMAATLMRLASMGKLLSAGR